ncbi:MAG: hypothetical protein IPJ61_02545 [Tessaracoccus sp.]|uniref:hypothetical protein n=1 Tax=Tessaracoccus sp. TaxID=1971211 RepID=UPI001EB57CC8|nr:hypothetical protein [Tessaracoccus sp.]MBK7819967.1 hypothetical protein [Tessaracoccus sp.]
MTSPENPRLQLWFGNFFEPFHSDAEAMRHGLAEVANLGFTTINLDSKPWEDFFARYRGEPASGYVGMQELMMAEAAARGMDYTCLALYLSGDNLYPTIRDVPPVRGEETIRPDGTPMGTYKYWSSRAQESMVAHVTGLLDLYGAGMRRSADGRVLMQTMFDPIAKPSFDDDGRRHYLNWLSNRYAGDVTRLADAYGVEASSFDDLQPSQYWLRPEEVGWLDCALPTAADIAARTPDFRRWVDNQAYLADVLVNYFADMAPHWRRLGVSAEPILHQWGYFFTPPGRPEWQTGQRALDVYRIAPHVDNAWFITAPLNAESRPDAMVVSVDAAIMRAANGGSRFSAGVYLGRHVNQGIYDIVTPAEAVATLVAGGANGYHAYGYSGLDDGGVLYRMDDGVKQSVRDGNAWAAQVIPLLTEPRAREVALLFPAETNLYEPLELDEGGRHRMDLLGWYRQFTDLGWHVDILHPDQVAAGALADYATLVIPANPLYDVGDNAALESAVAAFVDGGGTVFHGPGCGPARALGIVEQPHEFDCIAWEDELIPHGWSIVAYPAATALGSYLGSGLPALAETRRGAGTVYSFGFEYGYAYCRQHMPIVPPQYGKREQHPLVLLRRTPVEALIGSSPLAVLPPSRGLEVARFGDRAVVINHRSHPIDIGALSGRRVISQVPGAPGWLPGHAAAYVEV